MNRLTSRYGRLYCRRGNLLTASRVCKQCLGTAAPCSLAIDSQSAHHQARTGHLVVSPGDPVVAPVTADSPVFRLNCMSSSITRYRFEDPCTVDAVAVSDDFLFILQRMKNVIEALTSEDQRFSTGITSYDNVRTFAMPYSYTADDILDSRLHGVRTIDSEFPGRCIGNLSTTEHIPNKARIVENDFIYDSDLGSRHQNFLPCDMLFFDPAANDWLSISESRMLLKSSEIYARRNSTALIKIPDSETRNRPMLAVKTHWNDMLISSHFGIAAFCSLGLKSDHHPHLDVRRSWPVFLDYPYPHGDEASVNGRLRFKTGSRENNDASATPPDGKPEDGRRLPNEDQLRLCQENLVDNMPKLFIKGHNYDMYTEDVIFENNWFLGSNNTTVGKQWYSVEITKLRLFIHFRLANVRVHVLKSTVHVEDGTVRVRWRIAGIPQERAIMFWKYLPWSSKNNGGDDEGWLDGFSTFFVNQNGLVCKHKMDRIIPDDGQEAKAKPSLMEKLAQAAAPTATT